MSRPNSKVIKVIKGYEVIPARQKGDIFLRSPGGVNFSFNIAVLDAVATLIRTNPQFRMNFYDKQALFTLVQTRQGGRPNEKVLAVIQGYQFFKSRDLGMLFIRSPQGVNFSLDIDVLMMLQEDLQNPQFFAIFN